MDSRFAAARTLTDAYGTQKTNDPSYYFAAIWQSILGEFNFTGSQSSSDRAEIRLCTTAYQSKPKYDAGPLFEALVLEMPKIIDATPGCTSEDVYGRLVSALREDSDLPRMIVLIRWRENAFDERERGKIAEKISNEAADAKHSRPIIVVDLDQSTNGDLPDTPQVGKHDLYVVPLGLFPDRFPLPFRSAEWDPEEEGIKKDIANTAGKVIPKVATSIRRRFEIATEWKTVVSSADEWRTRLRVEFEDPDLREDQRPRCDLKLNFPSGTVSEQTWQALRKTSVGMAFGAVTLCLFIVPLALVLSRLFRGDK